MNIERKRDESVVTRDVSVREKHAGHSYTRWTCVRSTLRTCNEYPALLQRAQRVSPWRLSDMCRSTLMRRAPRTFCCCMHKKPDAHSSVDPARSTKEHRKLTHIQPANENALEIVTNCPYIFGTYLSLFVTYRLGQM